MEERIDGIGIESMASKDESGKIRETDYLLHSQDPVVRPQSGCFTLHTDLLKSMNEFLTSSQSCIVRGNKGSTITLWQATHLLDGIFIQAVSPA